MKFLKDRKTKVVFYSAIIYIVLITLMRGYKFDDALSSLAIYLLVAFVVSKVVNYRVMSPKKYFLLGAAVLVAYQLVGYFVTGDAVFVQGFDLITGGVAQGLITLFAAKVIK